MTSIQALRARLPFVVFVFVLLLVVVLVGFACACITSHPSQAIDRAISAIPAAPPVVEVWAWIVLLLVPASLLVLAPLRARGRASPPALQRFLF